MKIRHWKNISKSLLLTVCCLLASCSQPILESEQCIAARGQIKKFYSYHFGNDMKPTRENLIERKEYLSENLFERLNSSNEKKVDYFTQTSDYPKAFRIGKCESSTPNETIFEVLLFWRTNETNIQKELNTELTNKNGRWVINDVAKRDNS